LAAAPRGKPASEPATPMAISPAPIFLRVVAAAVAVRGDLAAGLQLEMSRDLDDEE
jgi:hypothetical protein